MRTKMTILFGLIVLIGCLVLWFVSENRAGSALEAEARDAVQKVAKQAADTIDGRLQARIAVVESLADNSVIRGRWGDQEATPDEKLQVLRDEQKRVANLFKQFGIADTQGNAFFSDGSTVSIADRDYFKEALGGKTAVSSTIVSRIDNSVVFAFATPIHHYATGEITGVLIGIADAAKLSELIGGITYARTGYAFVVDGTGKTIGHKDVQKVTSQENIIELARSNQALAPLAAIISKMVRGEDGVENYSYQGQEKILAYAPIKTTGWSVAVTAPKAEVLDRASGLRTSMLLISFLIVVVALALTFAIARSIVAPLVLAVDHLGLIASGDFTRPVPEKFLRMRDEIGRLAQAVDRLQENIRPLLSGLKENARTLAGSSENLSAASEEIASSSGEVARAIQQVAAGASEQAGHLQEIGNLIEEITESLERVYTELGHVKEKSEETSRLAGVGKKELDALVASIESVRDAFRVVTERLTSLTGSVDQVGEILEVINDIAEQTNLLALNAAIEAARAGEAGRGFAVVAEEVRKLAEQSRSSSDKIKALLGSIASETRDVVSTSEDVSRQVVAQLENVENTIKSFDDILDSVAAMVPEIEAVYRDMDSTVRAKDVVLDRVQSISAVAEETSASAEEISASAEELSASTEEIAASAQELLNISKQLEEQVEKFQV